MNELSKEKTMTVKEVADIMKVSERTIQRSILELFPEIVTNGVTTYLNEIQVTQIKLKLDKHHNLVNTDERPKTDLEVELIIQQAMILQQNKIDRLTRDNQFLEGRVNRLIHDSKTYTTTEIAKELNLKSPSELNKILQEKGIQYKVNKTWVLSAKYSDQGFESIKQDELDNGMIIYNRHWTGKGRDFILNLLK